MQDQTAHPKKRSLYYAGVNKLTDLMQAAGLSRRGFFKAFTKHIGISPGQLIRRMRIEHAKRLLVECNLNLNEIAKQCGYRSVNTFWVAFREETGLAPKKYQRQEWLMTYRNQSPSHFSGISEGKRPRDRLVTKSQKAPTIRSLSIAIIYGLMAIYSWVKAQIPVRPALPALPSIVYNIQKYGAIGDGVTTNTEAIQAAIDAASAAGGGVVEVPIGVYLSGPLLMASRINLSVGGTLRILPLDKYPGGTVNPANFISGAGLHDIAISGSGTIDGQGIPWWPYAKIRGARRPRMISFSSCERVLIENVRLTNSPMFHIAISGKSTDVTVRGVTIRANPSTDSVNPGHNTDACDVSGKNILIQDCDVSVGDDNFTCGGGTSDVLITNCTYGFGHGVSIGSPTAGGVSNFMVINCTFNNTDSGIRIKSDRGRGGFLHDLSYLNLRMTNVGCPILIYASYMATNPAYRALDNLTAATAATYSRSAITGRTPIYRDITFSNITATVQPGRRAGLIWGLPEMAVTNVFLQRVNITADKPFGIYAAQNVRMVNCQIITPSGVNKLSCTNAQVCITP